jgi:hypothetical protein
MRIPPRIGRRRWFWLLCVLALAGTAALCFSMRSSYTHRAHNIDGGAFEKIRPGMTLSELEELFGVPPGNYSRWGKSRRERMGLALADGELEWVSDKYTIEVLLDENGRVDIFDIDIAYSGDLNWIQSLQLKLERALCLYP